MSAENNSDIKLCQNTSIENMWKIFCRQKICLKTCRQLCQTYYVVTTLDLPIANKSLSHKAPTSLTLFKYHGRSNDRQ